MSPLLQSNVALFGRILMSVIFLISGWAKLTHWTGTESFMTAYGMPAVPLLLAGAVLVEILGGLALLLGWQTRAAALILFLYLIPTTLIFHHFWSVPSAEQQTQLTNFLKNLAILGGLLTVTAWGAGALSLDARYARRWPTLQRFWAR